MDPKHDSPAPVMNGSTPTAVIDMMNVEQLRILTVNLPCSAVWEGIR